MGLVTLRCAGCGASIQYDAGSEMLKCPYCGRTERLAPSRDRIREIPLEEALAGRYELQRESLSHHQVASCTSCGAQIAYEGGKISSRCDFCGADTVQTAPLSELPIAPQGVLPFAIEPKEAQAQFLRWLRALWFAPSDLTKRAHLLELRGVYLPLWTFDAQAEAYWQATPGYHRTRTERFYNAATKQYELRQVTYIEWGRPVEGKVSHRFDDIGVSGLNTLPQRYLEEVGGFSTATDLIDYDPRYFLGWDVVLPDIDLKAAWAEAQKIIYAAAEAQCKSQIPGDTYKDFSMRLSLYHPTTKLAYVPIYILAYRYGSKPYRVVVHGRNGVVAGDRPISWVKVALAVITVILAIGVLGWLSTI